MQRCNVVPESMQPLIPSPECIVTVASFETDAISDGFHDGDTGTNCQHLPSTVRLGTGDLTYSPKHNVVVTQIQFLAWYIFVLEGDSWSTATLQSCKLNTTTYRCHFHLQQTILSGIRNDTGTPLDASLRLLDNSLMLLDVSLMLLDIFLMLLDVSLMLPDAPLTPLDAPWCSLMLLDPPLNMTPLNVSLTPLKGLLDPP